MNDRTKIVLTLTPASSAPTVARELGGDVLSGPPLDRYGKALVVTVVEPEAAADCITRAEANADTLAFSVGIRTFER